MNHLRKIRKIVCIIGSSPKKPPLLMPKTPGQAAHDRTAAGHDGVGSTALIYDSRRLQLNPHSSTKSASLVLEPRLDPHSSTKSPSLVLEPRLKPLPSTKSAPLVLEPRILRREGLRMTRDARSSRA